MQSNRILIGYHFPKTGGTTILGNFHESFGKSACVNYGHHAYLHRFLNDEPLLGASGEEAKATRVVFGHGVNDDVVSLFAGRDIHLFCAIRDPVSHAISQYKHYLRYRGATKRQMSFPEFYRTRSSDLFAQTIVRQFPGLAGPEDASLRDKVMNVLRNFRFVVTTDKLDEQAAHIYRFMGAPVEVERRRVYPESVDLGDITREAILEDNKLDCELNTLTSSYVPPPTDVADDEQFGPFGYEPDAARRRIGEMIARKNPSVVARSIDYVFVKQLAERGWLPAARAKLRYQGTKIGRLGRLILREPVDYGDNYFASTCFSQEGEVHIRQHEWEKARQAYTNAVMLNPKSVKARQGLARALISLRSYHEARETLQSIGREGAEHPMTLKLLEQIKRKIKGERGAREPEPVVEEVVFEEIPRSVRAASRRTVFGVPEVVKTTGSNG